MASGASSKARALSLTGSNRGGHTVELFELNLQQTTKCLVPAASTALRDGRSRASGMSRRGSTTRRAAESQPGAMLPRLPLRAVA